MTKTFTRNEIIQFLYNELPPNEQKRFETALQSDENLMNEYLEMKKVISQLDQSKLAPSKAVTKKILAYSRNYSSSSAKVQGLNSLEKVN